MERSEFDGLEIRKDAAGRAKDEYNEIADEYQEATKRKLRECAYNPSWVKLLGDLKGKNIKALDLACGEGISSRLVRDQGADVVVGVDTSEELIKKSIEQEKLIKKAKKQEGIKEPVKPIEYIVGDVSKLPIKGKFDIVTGAMMINYCSSEEMLRSMILGAKSCLKPKGKFLLSIPNPERMKGSDSYGVRMTPKSQSEGSEVEVELSDFNGKKYCDFTNYLWSKETYEKIFNEAGFEIKWIPSEVSNEGIEEFGEEFWEAYKANPVYIMIEAKLMDPEGSAPKSPQAIKETN